MRMASIESRTTVPTGPSPPGAWLSGLPVTDSAMSRAASRAVSSGTPLEVRVSATLSVVTCVRIVPYTASPTAAA